MHSIPAISFKVQSCKPANLQPFNSLDQKRNKGSTPVPIHSHNWAHEFIRACFATLLLLSLNTYSTACHTSSIPKWSPFLRSETHITVTPPWLSQQRKRHALVGLRKRLSRFRRRGGGFEHEMVWTKCNSTQEYEKSMSAGCLYVTMRFWRRALVDETDLWHGLEFHHFGLILSALFGLISVLMSFYLIWRHCTHYLKPWEQRQWVDRHSSSMRSD